MILYLEVKGLVYTCKPQCEVTKKFDTSYAVIRQLNKPKAYKVWGERPLVKS
ncbi:hypothetical protein ACTFRP_32905 [Bacillus cereus group sp. MYBK234-1]|uniref:hypothetical protein n=1 Tax=unclassified Bacillus cereus group TaxID=2750818 RepID=UPI003F7AB435